MKDGNSIKLLRKTLSERRLTLQIIDYFIGKVVAEEGQNDLEDIENQQEYLDFLQRALELLYKQSVDIVYEHSESEIETIFLNSLILSFLKADPLSLVFTPPFNDVWTFVKAHRNELKSMLKINKKYREHTGTKNSEGFLVYVENLLKDSSIDKEQYRWYKDSYNFIHKFGFYNSFFLTMQAGFPHLKVDEKSIRVDIYIWIPANEKFNLIVECDGFHYHKEKETFISDRKRDRLLKFKDFEVLRYSGSEIFKDPIAASNDLFYYMQKIDHGVK